MVTQQSESQRLYNYTMLTDTDICKINYFSMEPLVITSMYAVLLFETSKIVLESTCLH